MAEWASEPLATLRAALDRIIPADGDPGALDLGVDAYVLNQLAGDASVERSGIRSGLAALDEQSVSRFGKSFASLDASRRDELLHAVADAPWFRILCELAAEGFYADPGNGGNRGARSWTMIGYEHRLPEGPSGPPGREPIHAASPNRERMAADTRGG